MGDQTAVWVEGTAVRSTGTRCRNCGEYLSAQFAKVFGNNQDEIYACPECGSLRSLHDGGGTEPVGSESAVRSGRDRSRPSDP